MACRWVRSLENSNRVLRSIPRNSTTCRNPSWMYVGTASSGPWRIVAERSASNVSNRTASSSSASASRGVVRSIVKLLSPVGRQWGPLEHLPSSGIHLRLQSAIGCGFQRRSVSVPPQRKHSTHPPWATDFGGRCCWEVSLLGDTLVPQLMSLLSLSIPAAAPGPLAASLILLAILVLQPAHGS